MILDGKALSQKIKDQLKEQAGNLINQYQVAPCLAIVQVEGDSASDIYVRNKIKAAAYCNMKTEHLKKSADITMQEMLDLINQLNNSPDIHGIIVQLPLPKHLNEEIIINLIKNEKDVDGFGAINRGKMFSGLSSFEPATPKGIIKLLDEYNINIAGKRAVVVGRSNIVGKPIAMMLLSRNATVTIAHSRTINLKDITKDADILIVAIGKDRFIKGAMVKEGAVVVDVGINRVDGKIYGDVDFEEVSKKASYLTPVPGGVGPLTIVSLLSNTLEAYQNQMDEVK